MGRAICRLIISSGIAVNFTEILGKLEYTVGMFVFYKKEHPRIYSLFFFLLSQISQVFVYTCRSSSRVMVLS